MNISTWLREATGQLKQDGIATARLDCIVLLVDVLAKDRSWILAHLDEELLTTQADALWASISRRQKHEPLAYIRGKTEFYGREFIVNRHVLEPRPESETIIELLKQSTVTTPSEHIIDVGTGSGALAITAKLEAPIANVTAIDIDPECIKVARKNAEKHGADITLLEGNLLSPLTETLGSDTSLTLLANLPYVPDAHQINQAALMEPRLAIFGGEDGLDLYWQMFSQIREFNLLVTTLITESLPFQHQKLTDIAEQFGYQQVIEDDFIQVFSRLLTNPR
jgi:release factor glutamine methyltransferase